LLLVPILIFSHYFFFKRSAGKAVIFSNMDALRRLVKGNILSANITHLILRCFIIIFLIVGASGLTLWVMGESSDVNMIFALDSSASMSSSDVGESRFDVGKSIISDILSGAPQGSEFAFIRFAGSSVIENSFTDNRAELLFSLEGASTFRMGGTDVGGAIVTATNLFELRPDSGKVLILISDGLDNVNSFISSSPIETVAYARDNQVIIHSIAIGGEGGPLGFLPEYYEIPSMFSDELLILMSNETGGNYYRVESLNDAAAVINELQFETTQAYVNYNLFYWAFVVVFVLLVIEWVFANTYFRRVL
jgi:hypothetical protein